MKCAVQIVSGGMTCTKVTDTHLRLSGNTKSITSSLSEAAMVRWSV
jgi:hypothetical protein